MNIGLIGLGNMGSGMAANLARAFGSSLWVFDLDASKMQKAVTLGAQAAEDVAQLAQQCEFVLTSLPAAQHVNAVGQVLFEHLRPGSQWWDTSTNDLAQWQALRAQAPDYLTLIDAPITGGYEGAAAGTLTVLIGATAEQCESALPVLEVIAQRWYPMGPSGAGYVTKLAQLHLNYLVAVGMGEALMLGRKAGLDLSQLHEIFGHSCAQSYVVDAYTPRVLDGSYDPSFALGLAQKDMQLVSDLAAHYQTPVPLANMALEQYKQATQAFGFDAAHLSVLRLIEQAAGDELR